MTTLKQKVEAAERFEVRARAGRNKSRMAKAAIDRQARERGRAASSALAPRIPERPFKYEPLPFDCAFMTVSVNVLAKHRRDAFTAAHTKSVSSVGNSLSAHMKDFPIGTLQLILASRSASFMPSTVNAVCTLLFAVRLAF